MREQMHIGRRRLCQNTLQEGLQVALREVRRFLVPGITVAVSGAEARTEECKLRRSTGVHSTALVGH